ncbi:MAG: glutamate formimidoyltransferase [Saprospiraceae bacterium]
MRQLIECVPNFSEGRDPEVIRQIAEAIQSVEGVSLLDTDPGKAAHRTVITFVGEPAAVVEAAFRAIQKAAELIDMRKHHGEHPRMGATDVCPLVPVSNITLDETAHWAEELGRRVGEKLGIPVYLYEAAATSPERRNLAHIRAGEYEGLPDKIARPEWRPDFGPAQFNPRSGATVIGARNFLIAYNVNLNTTSTRRANSVAFDVREAGRVVPDPATGKPLKDAEGNPIRQPGLLKGVKGIGWYIEEYGIAQVSMNITDIAATPLHMAFEACCESASRRGMRVTGSELVGLVPLQALLDAGRYFLKKQKRSVGVSDAELIKIAVKSMGLDELTPFDPKRRVIEYSIQALQAAPPKLVARSLEDFAQETASESPAPGGGSISAYVGALGAALGAMVANLSAHKRGWDDRWEAFSDAAARAQEHLKKLLRLVDADTDAFNQVMAAFALPKGSEAEKAARKAAIQDATRQATETPLEVMRAALQSFDVLQQMADSGNPNSASDAGVGALCARAAVRGAYLNVRINLAGIEDRDWAAAALQEAEDMLAAAERAEAQVLASVESKI